MITRAVDARRYFGIHADYPGMLHTLAYHKSTLADLADYSGQTPLDKIASELRLSVQPGSDKANDMVQDARALATVISRGKKASTMAAVNSSTDVMISSWSKQDSYLLDFGLGLGAPEAVRRPAFNPVEGLVFFMSKQPDGETAVMICLRDEDLEGLKSDGEFTRCGQYIG